MARYVCPECGNVCDDSDGFCTKCGREFSSKDKAKQQQQANPFAQFTPASAPDMPADELMSKGFELMAADNYVDAMAYWKKAVTKGCVPDDSTYQRMLTDTGSAMLRISDTSSVTIRKGASDLSMVLDDRDFSEDLLKEYAARVKDCSDQVMLVNLSTNYMLLMVESFEIYTDIRDLLELCHLAQDFLKAVLAREEDLKNDGLLEPDMAMKYIRTNVDFADVLEAKTVSIMSGLTDERMDELGDKWAEQSSFAHVQHLLVALKASIDTWVAGKFSSKMMLKVRDGEIAAFYGAYLSVQ